MTGVQLPGASPYPLPASYSLSRGARLAVGHAIELQQRVTTDHYRYQESMINPSAHGLSLEPGESYGELGYAVYRLYVFLNTRDDDFRI